MNVGTVANMPQILTGAVKAGGGGALTTLGEKALPAVISSSASDIVEIGSKAINKAKTPTAKIIAGIAAGVISIGLIAKAASDKNTEAKEQEKIYA